MADLGLPAMDMGALLDDYDLYPDEILGDIAHKLGFGALYEDTVGVAIPRPWRVLRPAVRYRREAR